MVLSYIMNTAVSGLIKIGKTQTKQFQERMRLLEGNGYYNVTGLKKAIRHRSVRLRRKRTFIA